MDSSSSTRSAAAPVGRLSRVRMLPRSTVCLPALWRAGLLVLGIVGLYVIWGQQQELQHLRALLDCQSRIVETAGPMRVARHGGSTEAAPTRSLAAENIFPSVEPHAEGPPAGDGTVQRYYGPLFAQFNLSPDSRAQLSLLLAERGAVVMDAREAAEKQGIDSHANAALRSLIVENQREIDRKIATLLGAPAYATYERFRETLPMRELVNELRRSLNYAGLPPTDWRLAQMERQILTAFEPQ